jgi:predicted RNase H-like HicB family nuclease
VVDEVTRYTATARRTDGWWIVQCDQHPGALSQVKRLDQAAEEHREAIAFVAEVPVDEVDVEVRQLVKRGDAVRLRMNHPWRRLWTWTDELDRASALAASARRDEEVTGQKRREVARRLAEDGLTVRDIGAVLGVSYQRAHQLVSGATR